MPVAHVYSDTSKVHFAIHNSMQIEKECACCGALYIVEFSLIERAIDWPEDCENTDDDGEEDVDPVFCPFCGKHESEEGDDE